MSSITMIFGEIETCHTCKHKQLPTDDNPPIKGVFWCDAKAIYKFRSVKMWKCRKWAKADGGE